MGSVSRSGRRFAEESVAIYRLVYHCCTKSHEIGRNIRSGTILKQRVLIPQQIAQAGIDFLLRQGYEVIMGSDYSEATIAREVKDCDAILVRATPVTEQVLENANRLKIIARFGVGYDNVDLSAAAKRKIYVTNTPLANSNAVAEYTIFLLLACAKRHSELQPVFLAGD